MIKGKAEISIKVSDDAIEFITPKTSKVFIRSLAEHISLWKAMLEIIEKCT